MENRPALQILILNHLNKKSYNDFCGLGELIDAVSSTEVEVRKELEKLASEALINLSGEPEGLTVCQITYKGRSLIRSYPDGSARRYKDDTSLSKEDRSQSESYRQRWIKLNNFRHDPFLIIDTENDKNLWLYFLKVNYFTEVSGDAYHAESSLVFGPPGVGKSSIRRYLTLDEDAYYRAFAVEITDFSPLLSKFERGKVILKDIITLLISVAVKKLAERASVGLLVKTSPDTESKEAHPIDCQRLWTYCFAYHQGPLGEIEVLHQQLHNAQSGKKPSPTPFHLQEFCRLICTIFSRPTVYFLIDPSMYIFEDKREKFWMCIQPLLQNVDLHNFGVREPKMVFKYFLDLEFRKKMVDEIQWIKIRENTHVRSLRLWTQDELVALLKERLFKCSTINNRERNMNELMDPDEKNLNLEGELTSAAEGRPRSLIETCAHLFQIHTDRLPNAPFVQINRSELEKALAKPKREEQENEVRKLLSSGKHQTQDIKETLRYNSLTKQDQDKDLELEVIEAICGMANGEGGVVWIGVHDDGSIYGIESDFSTLNLSRQNKEGFSDELHRIISRYTGNDFSSKIRDDYHDIEGHKICRITVQRSDEPIFVVSEEENIDMFPVRFGDITKKLNRKEQTHYIKEHFHKKGEIMSNS